MTFAFPHQPLSPIRLIWQGARLYLAMLPRVGWISLVFFLPLVLLFSTLMAAIAMPIFVAPQLDIFFIILFLTYIGAFLFNIYGNCYIFIRIHRFIIQHDQGVCAAHTSVKNRIWLVVLIVCCFYLTEIIAILLVISDPPTLSSLLLWQTLLLLCVVFLLCKLARFRMWPILLLISCFYLVGMALYNVYVFAPVFWAVTAVVLLLLFVIFSSFPKVFYPLVILFEGLSLLQATKKSYMLTWGSWWRILMVLIAGILPCGLLMIITWSLLGGILGFVVASILSVLLLPYINCLIVMMYHDLNLRRTRKLASKRPHEISLLRINFNGNHSLH